MDLITLFGNLLLFLALMIPGYIMAKTKVIGETAQAVFGSVLMYIAMPFLVFQKLLETDLRSLDWTAVAIATILPLLLGLLLLGIAALIFPNRNTPAKAIMSRFCSFLHNCGFWGLPLAAALFPDKPEVTLYVSFVNIINTLLLLTVGVYVLSGDARSIRIRGILTSPAIIALVVGSIFSLSGVSTRFPQIIDYAARLANLAAPLSMLSLGIESAKLSFRELFSAPDLYRVSAIKLFLSPLLIMGTLLLLRGCGLPISVELLDSLFLSTAVSCAASAPAMAAKYDLDAKHAAILTIGTTLLCVITMPLLYGCLKLFY